MDIARVLAVAVNDKHQFSKTLTNEIEVVEGLGVRGDAHFGKTTQHVFQARRDPSQPNLRQVHLIQAELFEELKGQGFEIGPADLGENITTKGIDLLSLPTKTRLLIGNAVLEVTGLRNPCIQIEQFSKGLLAAVSPRSGNAVFRKAGIMSVVIKGGLIRPGDAIVPELPAQNVPLVPI